MPKIKGPNQETVAGKNFIYLDLPKSMDNCTYDLELVEIKMNDDEDKYIAVFKVLSTDTKVKVGSDISHMMDPFQKFADTYFWRDMFTIYLVVRGKEPTKERLEALAAKYADSKKALKFLDKLIADEFKMVGGTCTCAIRSYEKDDKRKTVREWSTLDLNTDSTDEEGDDE